MDDEPVSPTTEHLAARRVVAQHGEPGPGVTGRCRHCRENGCPMLARAVSLLKRNVPRYRPIRTP